MGSNFDKLIDGMELQLSSQDSAKQVIELALDRISSDPNNPRQQFDEGAMKDLAASIEQSGVLQPITVRPAGEDGQFIIRYGDRRFRAARMAGLSTIPAIISEAGDESDVLVEQVIENDQRADLSAAEMATAVKRLVAAGLRQNDIAKKLGRPKALISMYAAVASMPPVLADLAGTLAIRTVYDLHQAWKLDAGRVETLVAERAGASISSAEARALIKDIEDRAEQAEKSLSEQTPPTPAAEATPVEEVPAPAPSKRRKTAAPVVEQPPLLVEVDGRRGRLVLSGKVGVLFDGADAAEEIDASAIRPAAPGDK
jgi:ParB family transcriptional regulator, chromosome partitioning protein